MHAEILVWLVISSLRWDLQRSLYSQRRRSLIKMGDTLPHSLHLLLDAFGFGALTPFPTKFQSR